MKFLIQTIKGEIVHDFSFTLMESLKYQKWINPNGEYNYIKSNSIKCGIGYIPCGSVEFVTEYFNKYSLGNPKPRNVPECLFKYAGRSIKNGTEKDITSLSFVKSNDRIKHYTEICESAPVGNYQISELINIDSEYRCFVHKNKLVGIQYYLGNFKMFPNIDTIEKMIADYTDAPIAYTLDVGISNNNTIIIEVHDFFSCGLYGFSDHNIYPFMLSQWFYEYIKNHSK